MTDPFDLQELSLINPPLVEDEGETETEIPDNELTLKYMAKMDEVRVLRDSIASTSSSLDALRNEYVFGNDPAERVRLTNEILQLETRIPTLQRALDKASGELGSIEMEFLKEGIFLNMDMQKDFVVQTVNSVTLDPANSGEVIHVKDIVGTVITTSSGETTAVEGGYLDIGILDTMKDLLVNLIGAVVFSTIGYLALKNDRSSKVADSLMIRPNVHEEDEA
jgi:hypothetical protein